MRFTPTADFLTAAKAAAKILTWRFFTRTVSVLNTTIVGYGGWTEVTAYVNMESFTGARSGIEMDIAQGTIDSLTLEGRNIRWWKASVFTASPSQYVELKVEMQLGLGETPTPDIAYVFSGFITRTPVPHELDDSIAITVETAEAIGQRISYQSISTQYVDTDVDGAGLDALILPKIPGVYVTDAGITSFNLALGKHTITYLYNAGSPQAKLDEGDYTALPGTDGTVILINDDGLQKVELYVRSTAPSLLSDQADPIEDVLVVTTLGATLPNQPYRTMSIKTLTGLIYAKLGISDVSYDELEYDSYNGGVRASYIDYPPMDVTQLGRRGAIASDGTDLFIAVGNKIFKRTMATGAYSLLTTLTTGAGVTIVKKMVYMSTSAGNSDLLIFYSNTTNGDIARRYRINTSTLAAEVVLNATAGTINHFSMEPVQYNYTGSSWKEGFLYSNPGVSADIYFWDETTNSASSIYTPPGVEQIIAYVADFIFTRSTGQYWFLAYDPGIGFNVLINLTVDSGGSWVLGAGASTRIHWPSFSTGAYLPSEDRVYYFEAVPGPAGTVHTPLRYFEVDGDEGDDADVLTDQAYNPFYTTIWYDSVSGKIYMAHGGTELGDASLRSIVGGVSETIDPEVTMRYFSLVRIGSVIYAVDSLGRLFKIDTSVSMYVADRDFTDSSITDALNEMLRGYNLIATISPAKRAHVYRRGDADGNPQNSGNSVSITVDEAMDITENVNSYLGCGFVKISNGVKSATFDGTNYDSGVLTDVRSVEITSRIIPSTNLRDMAKYVYNFFHPDRTMYSFPLEQLPLFQFEPFDGADVDFTTTKILKTGSGVIYAAEYQKPGSVIFDVLI